MWLWLSLRKPPPLYELLYEGEGELSPRQLAVLASVETVSVGREVVAGSSAVLLACSSLRIAAGGWLWEVHWPMVEVRRCLEKGICVAKGAHCRKHFSQRLTFFATPLRTFQERLFRGCRGLSLLRSLLFLVAVVYIRSHSPEPMPRSPFERCRVQLRQKDGELAQRDQVARADAVQLAPLLCSILQDLSKFFIETKSRSLEYVCLS